MSSPGATGHALIFVYNVDASPVALLKDLYSGLTTGSTDCHLCDLTYGRMLKDRSWKQFVDDLPLPVAFQMRSTFVGANPNFADAVFPAAFHATSDGMTQVLAAEAINAADDLDALRTLVADTVAALPPQEV